MRPDIWSYMILLAATASTRSTCVRRQVGAVITDDNFKVLSTGYNGVPAGSMHCIDHPCKGALAPSGTDLSSCRAIHAEVNAVVHCTDLSRARFLFCTDSPCDECTKLLLATEISHIFYLRPYPHSEARELWIKEGRYIETLKDVSESKSIAYVYATLGLEMPEGVPKP